LLAERICEIKYYQTADKIAILSGNHSLPNKIFDKQNEEIKV